MKTRTILIVEDESHIAEVVALKLRQAGFKTVIARDARDALATLEQHPVDLVIADIAMPGMSGLDLAKVLATRDGAAFPVILLTGMSNAVDTLDLDDTHVVDVIPKPFSPKHLLARTLEALDRPLLPRPVKAKAASSA
jgi:DNA-binding response OmpR family regulator